MDTDAVLRDLQALPPEAQREVGDFVAFLKARYAGRRPCARRLPPLRREPFIGMWKDRDDMADSGAWVRSMRRYEWREADG
jgi:hypothetical protein